MKFLERAISRVFLFHFIMSAKQIMVAPSVSSVISCIKKRKEPSLKMFKQLFFFSILFSFCFIFIVVIVFVVGGGVFVVVGVVAVVTVVLLVVERMRRKKTEGKIWSF